MKGIKGRIVRNFGIVILLITLVLEALFLFAVRQYYYGSAMDSLQNQAAVATAYYNKYAFSYNVKEKAKYIFESDARSDFPIFEVIDWDYTTVMTSYGSSGQQINTSDVKTALSGETGTWRGFSPDTGESIIAVSNPLRTGSRTLGVLRYTVSAEMLDTTVRNITGIALLIGMLAVAFAFAFSIILAKRIVRPIEEVTAVAERMAGGDFTTRAVKQHDDEVGALAETLNYMADEITKTDKLKNNFISSISHELRTPLTSIKGWGETLLSGNLRDYEETMLGLSVMAKETDRLIGLVEDLLDFSRLQAGEMKMDLVVFDLRTLATEVGEQFGFHERNKKLKLTVRTAAEPLPVFGDSNRIKQVLVNLVHNAYKFTPVDGAVTVTVYSEEGQALLEVQDNGEGMNEEEVRRVTEKFYKGETKQAGSGLGLAICKEIIELHKGMLHIESRKGEGTKVTVSMPLYKKEEKDEKHK
ncbi:sensor histidine kinase [Aneurinibacillus migulanus]|uniref:histidine kinase n=1 Tax=Aneurinibacillus migulanus TaxID=47500 RepID=A0A0D1VZY5_ANEMI|nr:HAMP domain-containing sensor histidine kinase [Aneurinibacillus migulanus]KIV51780.1 histidine kinase [Aneurinibacillus migulanus]KON97897.1 histidine kinase [Aneurinibacillus migulanus]MED0891139.1 HAMP domain-containing sensor histidine kinase [Aneurinibacillus migulanus]MED1614173.1 HAMP domain-containing sensor histidine kinase [Aneurinibacillus migulanus]SDH97620.1 Signal transduction histidine kinase [Aneurinibacillus migulanus]